MLVTLKLGAPSASASPLGHATHIIHSRARFHHWEGIGPLSIKSFRNGQAHYRSGAARFVVDDTAYLLLNEGQPYSLTVDAAHPVESFCIFFEAGWAEEVLRALTTSDALLLDQPLPSSAASLHFFDRTYPHDALLSPMLATLRNTLNSQLPETGWLETQLHLVMQRLLHAHFGVYQEVEQLPAARPATREELYRRLHRARDFIHASLDQPLSLQAMAEAACLSPNHLLRSWKRLFHGTPHQYLTACRLARARTLLLQSDNSVTEICMAVGFASPSSFSTLFRKHVGQSPTAFRRQKGDFEEASYRDLTYNGAHRL